MRREKFRCPNTLSLVSFAGMTLDKCTVLMIGTLTGCPLCRESRPLCRLNIPAVISIWLLVGFHPATRSVQCTPADNARKRAPGSIWRKEKERKSHGGPIADFEPRLVSTRAWSRSVNLISKLGPKLPNRERKWHILIYYPTAYIRSNCVFFAMSRVSELLPMQ